MPYYGPRVLPGQGVPTLGDILAEGIADLHRDYEEYERGENAQEMRELQLALEGVRRGTAPTTEKEVRVPEFETPAERRSEAAAEDPVGASMQAYFRQAADRGLTGPDAALIDRGLPGAAGGGALDADRGIGGPSAGMARDDLVVEDEVSPGQFVPGQGFVEMPIGLQARGDGTAVVEVPDPQYEQLTDEFYRTDPEYAQEQQLEQRRRAIAEAIGDIGMSDPTARAEAFTAGVPASVAFGEDEAAEPNAFSVMGREITELGPAVEAYRAFHPHSTDADGLSDSQQRLRTNDRLERARLQAMLLIRANMTPGAIVARLNTNPNLAGVLTENEVEAMFLAKQQREIEAAAEAGNGATDVNYRQRVNDFYGAQPNRGEPEPVGSAANPLDLDLGGIGSARPPGSEGIEPVTWRERADELRQLGLGPDEIIEQLRAEGLIE